MPSSELVVKIAEQVKAKFADESSGHDWWHIYRVWQLAKRLCAKERANMEIVELGALLHDIADWKTTGGDTSVGAKAAMDILARFGASVGTISAVADIVAKISFKGAGVESEKMTLEGEIVQDADRLDAIGAVGIARVFAYGGANGRLIHDPAIEPQEHATKEQYFQNKSTGINHFYEKLLLLKDRMNTKTAKRIAAGRHKFMLRYLERFYKEWEGKE